MNLYKPSRNHAFLLIIMIFGFTIVNAQDTSKIIYDAAKTTEKSTDFSLPSAKLSTKQNKKEFKKNEFNKKTSSPTEETMAGGEYKRQAKPSNREIGFYAGSFTFHKDLKGESQKAPVVLAGIRYAWTTKNNPSHRLRYYMDFNPLIIVNYREKRLIQETPPVTVGERKTVFGVGFTPVGLQFNWRNSRKFQPFIAGGFGVAIFNKKFPDNRSALRPDKIGNRFQLMPEFGAGVEIRSSEIRSYFIGYKYHHLSNGYTAPLNVGYNTNMVYSGMYFSRGR